MPTPQRSAAMIASIADPGVRTTRAPFGHALCELADHDPRIVGLSADLAKYTDLDVFAKAYPDYRADAQVLAQDLFHLGPNLYTQFLYFV